MAESSSLLTNGIPAYKGDSHITRILGEERYDYNGLLIDICLVTNVAVDQKVPQKACGCLDIVFRPVNKISVVLSKFKENRNACRRKDIIYMYMTHIYMNWSLLMCILLFLIMYMYMVLCKWVLMLTEARVFWSP